MSSLARRMAALGGALLLLALTATGGIMVGILHLQAVNALDEVLLAAAHAHSGRPPTWEVEHSEAPVEVWVPRAGDERVPAEALSRAADAERPTFLTLGQTRLLLLPAEVERHGATEHHMVIAARAPAVTYARSVGPWLAAYAVVAGLVALASALSLGFLVRRALRPMARAAAEADQLSEPGSLRRLTEDGPEEIRGFLHAINGLLERLEHAHRAQARFTDEAAHELRTPIAILLGELDLALRRPREAEQYRETLRSLQEEARRLHALVEGLLSLARLDAGSAPPMEPRSAAEIAGAAVAAEAGALDAAGCRLNVELRAEARALVSGPLVISALGNLLRNAAVHAPGSEIKLLVEIDGPLLVFRVEDQGPGVPEEQREAVFDRLARGGAARRSAPEGLGLGLPLAREVARRHGGTCTLEEAPGGGCAAILRLPALGGPTPG